jgi:NTP pyrophosphatase (non-canonical NTP hydrolase)
MTLQEIVAIQKKFDQQHESRFKWDQEINKNNPEMLGYLALALSGEAGEVANAVKKVMRGDISYEEQKDQIAAEVIDVFIYLIKFSYQMGFDLEGKFLEKLEVNKKRFSTFQNE